MKTIGKFKQLDHTFNVKVRKTESNSNYNVFCAVFEQDSKQALTGRTFKDTDTKECIMKWASESLGRPESEDFRRIILGEKPKTAEEEYPELDIIASTFEEWCIAAINLRKHEKTECPYPGQCILEILISKLERHV